MIEPTVKKFENCYICRYNIYKIGDEEVSTLTPSVCETLCENCKDESNFKKLQNHDNEKMLEKVEALEAATK